MDLPSEASLQWIVSSYAGLLARHGEGIGAPELVQPTTAFFPDPITPDERGVVRVVARMVELAPVRDGLDVRLRFVDRGADGGGCGTGGCGSGACDTGKPGASFGDRVIEGDDGYLLELDVSAIAHPVALAATVARAAGTLVLLEAEEDVKTSELGAMSEVAAVASGLGVLLASGAHVYGKSCGGARISHHTHLTLEELSVALALFSEVHEVKPAAVKSYFEVTQREAYDEALAWARSNPRILRDLRLRPEVVEAGLFRCEETKGVLGRFLSRRAAEQEDAPLSFVPARR
jgi:hypothetical protein